MEKIIGNVEHSQVLPLKELVSYEKNQVVSLTIANQPGVGITLMAFDEGTKIDTHVTPGDAMPNVLEGEAEFTVGDKKYIVKAGESIVMPINIPHSVRAVTKFKMMLVVVKKPE
ncbi:MAG: cupin domain-containing protein [Eubacterium sp.]|nr:cupin domain-containing protein [Eubacterium sp.]